MKRRQPMTPERMAYMRRNGWLPREPVRREPRDEIDLLPPWLPPWKPDEGETITFALDGLMADFATLGDLRDDISVIAMQANDAGYPISLTQLRSERRYWIASGLIAVHWACAAKPAITDPAAQAGELIRCFVAHIADDPGAQQPGIPLGAVVGSLGAPAAKAFCELAEAFEAGALAVTFTNSGRMYLPDDPDPQHTGEDMDLNELAPPTGDAIDLEIGDVIEGVLEHVGDWRPITGKFGTKDKSPWLLVTDDGNRTLWVEKNSRLARVLGNSIREAGLKDLELGGTLKVKRVEDVPTDKGNGMKDYKARYTPTPKKATLSDFGGDIRTYGDEEPF